MAQDNYIQETISLDEIVFQKRNKSYGAYNLRTNYRKILTKSFILGTLIFCLAAITPFVVMKIKQLTGADKKEVKTNLVEILPEEEKIFEEKKEEEPPPPPPKVEEKIEIVQNVVPEPTKAPKIETPPPPKEVIQESNIGAVAQEGEKKPQVYTPPVAPTSGAGKTIEAPKTVVDDKKVYEAVDVSAEYPGGMGALRKFLADNFDTSIFDGGEGKLTATLKFVVEKDGSVSGVQVTNKSGNKDFDEEAVRVTKKLKKWKPAKVDDQPVRSFYSVPFTMVFE